MKKVIILGLLVMMLIAPLTAEGVQEVVPAEGDFALTILHTNDTHSHLAADYKGRYGAAKVAFMADQIRAANKNVLLLDAGDYVMGTVYYTVFGGAAERDVMNLQGYDAMTLGNHEFDKGVDGMLAFLTGLNTPVVNANIDFSDYPAIDRLVKPYIIKDVNGTKVGIIGATLPETPTISSPADGMEFTDVVSAVQPVVDVLENMGVEIIVLLSHNGYMNDQAIAAGIDGVDVIVGGHSHTKLIGDDYPGVYESASGEPILIVQASEYNSYLGNLTVTFDDDGVATSWWGAPVPMTAAVAQDPEIAAYLAEKDEELAPFTGAIIGNVKTELIRSRTEESNIGNLIADAMLAATKDKGVQIALTNGGGIRADIGTGDLTMQKLMEVLPFGNLVATFEIKGADLWQAFDHGINQVEEGAGRFLHMAGAKMVWDPAGEPFDYATQTGGRVREIFVQDEKGGWAPLDPEAIYKVAANNYIRGGGDDFQVLKEKAINPYDAGALDLDVVKNFIADMPYIDYRTEGRITTVGK
ncbi:MAG: 5'-nucleotidase C-terminal domain-containing protein [Spirochaetales bacterium]|nr:5'-nucleotidase C-terminal domain-containing protein [Spirochaetales bacterium]